MGYQRKKWRKELTLLSPLLSKGHAHKVKHSVPQVCSACYGNGAVLDGHTNRMVECPDCQGEGEVLGIE